MNRIIIPMVFAIYPAFLFAQVTDTVKLRSQVLEYLLQSSKYFDLQDIDSARAYLSNAAHLCIQYLPEYVNRTSVAYNYMLRFVNDSTLPIQTSSDFIEALTIPDEMQTFNLEIIIPIRTNLAILLLDFKALETSEQNFRAGYTYFHASDSLRLNPLFVKYLTTRIHLYDLFGQYTESNALALEKLDIVGHLYGVESLEYINTQVELASSYQKIENFKAAEFYFLSSLDVAEKNYPISNPVYTRVLINMGYFYNTIGLTEKAVTYLSKAQYNLLHVLKDTISPMYPACLFNLSVAFLTEHRYSEALPVVLQVNRLDESVYGNKHPYYADGLDLTARCMIGLNRYDTAEIVINSALQIKQSFLDPLNPGIINLIFTKAYLTEARGEYATAGNLYKVAMAGYKANFGQYNQHYLTALNYYIGTLLEQNNAEQISSLIAEASIIQRELIQKGIHFLSDAELSGYINYFANQSSFYLSAGSRFHFDSTELNGHYYNDILNLKGYLQNAQIQTRKAVTKDSISHKLYVELKTYYSQLAKFYSVPISSQDTEAINDLFTCINYIEKEIANRIPDFHELVRKVTWKDIQNQIGKDVAVIEFLHCQYAVNAHEGIKDSVNYMALVLFADGKAPRLISLCNQQQLLNRLGIFTMADYNIDNFEMDANRLSAIYKLLWEPILPYLTGIKTIYFCPSGILYNFNLNATLTQTGNTLAEEYELVRLGSSRQLLDNIPVQEDINDAYLIGGIQFDIDTLSISLPSQYTSEVTYTFNKNPDFTSTDLKLRSESWEFLIGSIKEINAIQSSLLQANVSVTLLQGSLATEEVFKNLSCSDTRKFSPRVLHIATHGYFFHATEVQVLNAAFPGQPAFETSENPMIRSGLILAGGNYAWKYGHPYKPGMEDGILTAYEISQMDLSNTELVVLSACETGLGDIQGNEGVYGLQRAFKIAGVKNLIMSLWKVSDAATAELMISFYKHWLEDKMTIRQALHTAQMELRDEGFEPFYWAGWVLVE